MHNVSVFIDLQEGFRKVLNPPRWAYMIRLAADVPGFVLESDCCEKFPLSTIGQHLPLHDRSRPLVLWNSSAIRAGHVELIYTVEDRDD